MNKQNEFIYHKAVHFEILIHAIAFYSSSQFNFLHRDNIAPPVSSSCCV